MAITAGTIISRAQTLLSDITGTRWSEAELLGWLNDGQRLVALLKPEVKTTTLPITLAVGSKQSLPAGATLLVNVVRNYYGDTPGPVITKIDRKILDTYFPGWHTVAASVTIKHFVYESGNPKVFYTYPPAATGAKAECEYTIPPTDCANAAANIDLDDIYMMGLINYVVCRGLSKEAEYAGPEGRAQEFYKQFLQELGLREQVEAAAEPKAAGVVP